MRPAPLLPTLVAGLVVAAGTASAGPLERDWCVGLSPVSWGFSVTPSGAAVELRLKLATGGVQVLGGSAGPGLPAGWQATVSPSGELIARGESPLAAGKVLRHALVVETDAASWREGRGAHEPLTWRLEQWSADNQLLGAASTLKSFTPVLDLADAVSLGTVSCTVTTRSPAGPIEVTVDNPSWKEVWLDVPPGAVLTGGGAEWIVGLEEPFRMMARQKTGRTLRAFPVTPPGRSSHWPGSLILTGRLHEKAESLAELALAVAELDASFATRRPGPLESLDPFEFFPLLFQWSAWAELSAAEPALLTVMVEERIQALRGRGDPLAAHLDTARVVEEIEKARADLADYRDHLRERSLSIEQQAAAARFAQ